MFREQAPAALRAPFAITDGCLSVCANTRAPCGTARAFEFLSRAFEIREAGESFRDFPLIAWLTKRFAA